MRFGACDVTPWGKSSRSSSLQIIHCYIIYDWVGIGILIGCVSRLKKYLASKWSNPLWHQLSGNIYSLIWWPSSFICGDPWGPWGRYPPIYNWGQFCQPIKQTMTSAEHAAYFSLNMIGMCCDLHSLTLKTIYINMGWHITFHDGHGHLNLTVEQVDFHQIFS